MTVKFLVLPMPPSQREVSPKVTEGVRAIKLQLLRLEAVAGKHLHAGKACSLDGGGSFVKAVGQAVDIMRIRSDDDLAAHLLPLAQQPRAGVEVLAVAFAACRALRAAAL